MNIGQALEYVKVGRQVRVHGWGEAYIYMTTTPPYKEPFLVFCSAEGKLQAGWNPSTAELLSENWEVVS